jgi:MinD-like ATPase involved in chromosome partitioning or flagellar assembly
MNLNSRFNLSHVLNGRKSLEETFNLGRRDEIICGGSGIEDLANIHPFQRQRLVDEIGPAFSIVPT